MQMSFIELTSIESEFVQSEDGRDEKSLKRKKTISIYMIYQFIYTIVSFIYVLNLYND